MREQVGAGFEQALLINAHLVGVDLKGPEAKAVILRVFGYSHQHVFISFVAFFFEPMIAVVSAVIIPVDRIFQGIAFILRRNLLPGFVEQRLAPLPESVADAGAYYHDMICSCLKPGGICSTSPSMPHLICNSELCWVATR